MGLASIRPAIVADAAAIARVHVASSEEAYAPLAAAWPGSDLEERTGMWRELLAQTQADSRRVDLVAEIEGEVVGFIGGGPARRAEFGAPVEIYVIHVLPEHRDHGIGGALWTPACAYIRGPTLRSMYVETLAELRCCSFYEARGGECILREPDDMHGGAVTRVVYRWPDGQPCT
jgi:ribosomal protein S18 acetylase RimI-like enzyme